MYYSEMNSPVGNLLLLGDGTALTGLYMHDQKYRPPLPAGCRRDDRLFAPVRAQLEAYFAGELRRFDVRLSPRGTPFQQAVWQALCDIPYGATESYGAWPRASAGKARHARSASPMATTPSASSCRATAYSAPTARSPAMAAESSANAGCSTAKGAMRRPGSCRSTCPGLSRGVRGRDPTRRSCGSGLGREWHSLIRPCGPPSPAGEGKGTALPAISASTCRSRLCLRLTAPGPVRLLLGDRGEVACA